MKAGTSRLGGLLLGLAVLAAALAVWDVWPRTEWAAFYLPRTRDVARTAWDVWRDPDFLRAVVASVTRLVVGFALGAVAGVSVGVAMGSSLRARNALGPTADFLRAVPIIAVLPLAIVLLGDAGAMRVAVIAFGVFFPVLVAALDGVRAVSPEIRDTAALFGLRRVERDVRVYLPAALPTIFAGLRTALSIGLVLVAISEFNGAGDGLGVYIWNQRFLSAVPEMYAGILFLGLLGYLLNRLFLVLERRVLAWHYSAIGARVH
jgi:ABC-type nitrate/sulfonate/bicarbonate transport system permease component